MLGTDSTWTRERTKRGPATKKRRFGERSRVQGMRVDDFVREKGPTINRHRRTAEQEWEERGDFVRDYAWGPDRGVSYETRVTTRGKRPSMRYAQRTPWPTYSQWGRPQWVDVNTGVQYRKADGSDWALLVSAGVITKPDWNLETTKSGPQLLYLRFPKGGRTVGGMAFPTENDTLELLQLDTGALWRAKVHSTEGSERRTAATGNVRVVGLKRKSDRASHDVVERAFLRLPKKYQRRRLLSNR